MARHLLLALLMLVGFSALGGLGAAATGVFHLLPIFGGIGMIIFLACAVVYLP